jgi:hypothetical protein
VLLGTSTYVDNKVRCVIGHKYVRGQQGSLCYWAQVRTWTARFAVLLGTDTYVDNKVRCVTGHKYVDNKVRCVTGHKHVRGQQGSLCYWAQVRTWTTRFFTLKTDFYLNYIQS